MNTAPENNPRTRFGDLTRDELVEWCGGHSQPAYRADQIRKWVFANRANSFDEMNDLPKSLRVALAEHFVLFTARLARHLVARDRTEKLLLELGDGELVECVLMREDDRRTICISTQVGCAMGCIFCASGLEGWKRNLSTGEILEQVLRLDRLLPDDERITNLVVMGIGEPLANLAALVPALDVITNKNGLGLGARRITVSTVGLPEKIREFARLGHQYHLAISLHAPNDELRNRLVPVNHRIGVDAIMAAADDYFEVTGRRVTYEYVLLSQLNDGPDQARELADLLKGRRAHVNLIPMNPVKELDLGEPVQPRTMDFRRILEERGVAVTIRKRKGADIDAACGQLRLEHEHDRNVVTLDATSPSEASTPM
ncbi:MAG: 23S rRNA (adenine(2503)-C(2))-methyltransferase RlmN [Planctomycetaceae bacterium]